MQILHNIIYYLFLLSPKLACILLSFCLLKLVNNPRTSPPLKFKPFVRNSYLFYLSLSLSMGRFLCYKIYNIYTPTNPRVPLFLILLLAQMHIIYTWRVLGFNKRRKYEIVWVQDNRSKLHTIIIIKYVDIHIIILFLSCKNAR